MVTRDAVHIIVQEQYIMKNQTYAFTLFEY